MVLNEKAILYIPDGEQEERAFARTTHLAIAAHQDDIEFMAYAPIAECFGNQEKWFGAIVVTDGAGSPRSGLYADYTDEQMKEVRVVEQKKAAMVGEYGFLAMLRRRKSKTRRISQSLKDSRKLSAWLSRNIFIRTTLRTSTIRTLQRHSE